MEAILFFAVKNDLPSFTWVKVGFTVFAQPGLNRGLKHLWVKLANPGYCLGLMYPVC